MNLIILTEADRIGEMQFRLTDHRASHIREILRSFTGETVQVGMLNGPLGTASVSSVTPQHVELAIVEWREKPGLGYEVDLICAVPRPKTLKKVLTLCGMMGVRAVHFVRANRTDKSYVASSLLYQPDCLPYLLDGLSQGRFTRLPEISLHPLFRPFVEDELPLLLPPDGSHTKLLCDSSSSLILNHALSDKLAKKFAIVIGPEGGWVPFEIDLLQTAGFRAFTLGPWTLRVETAVTAALAQLEIVLKTQSH